MRTQLYTNIILTVIALLLAGIAVENFILPSKVRDVRLVSIVHPPIDQLKIARQEHRTIWHPIPINVSNEPIDVEVTNTPLEIERE